MSSTILGVIIFIVFVLLVAFCFITVYVIKNLNSINKKLEKDNQALINNINSVIRYSGLISSIKKDKEEVCNAILKAKTADEITDIIFKLIDSHNNERLQNN